MRCLSVSENGVFEGAHPRFTLFGVPGLEMESLAVDGDRERAVILVIYPNHCALQTDTPSAHTSHHLFSGLRTIEAPFNHVVYSFERIDAKIDSVFANRFFTWMSGGGGGIIPAAISECTIFCLAT